MGFIDRLLINKKAFLLIFIALAVFAGLQSYFGKLQLHPETGYFYTKYNNYLIFKQSFFHLIEGKDLYSLHESEHLDLFKYSPAFALAFGLFSFLPDALGLTLWDLLNALVFFFAVYFLPKTDARTKGLMLVFAAPELLGALQNEQSNGLIAGLLIFAFGFLEHRKYWLASLCLVATVFIKLFGIVGLALYLLYPDKLKLTYTTAFWVLLFTFLPLAVVGMDQFVFLYQSWGDMLADDHAISDGISVVGWLKTWFGWEVDKLAVTLVGMVLFCLPLLRTGKYRDYTFRALLLASVLVWVVIFNHRAESPTFIIAVSGVAVWYFAQAPDKLNFALLLLALVFTVFSATDLFPPYIRNEWMKPYVIKVVPCILVWAKTTYDLLAGDLRPRMQGSNSG